MKILLGSLKDKGDDLAKFLEPRIGAKPEVGGGEIDIEDDSIKKGVRSRHVKTYIKRFLSIEKVRSKYRVLVDAGEFRLVEIETDEEIEEELEKEDAKKKTERSVEKEAAKQAGEAAEKPAE